MMSVLVLGNLLLAAQTAGATALPSSEPPSPASVEIVVFSDFQCPFCAVFAKPFREVHTKGVDGIPVHVRFKHYPLPSHPLAPLAHQAALAAGEQGKFWEMHDLLFENRRRVAREDLIEHARTLNLDLGRFAVDLDSDRVKKVIATDLEEGARLRVAGTPTFLINGKQYSGAMSLDELTGLIRREQRRARARAEITDDMLSRGPADAPVTIELFADLQSPVTRSAVQVIDEAMTQHPAVRLQFRNFPLSFHPQAGLAHEAAMAAAVEGRFWEFATYVLDHQSSLREQDLIALAGRLGLEQTKFTDTLRERRYAPRVDADVETGTQKGLRGSPVILVNGRRIDGVPSLLTLTGLIDAAVNR